MLSTSALRLRAALLLTLSSISLMAADGPASVVPSPQQMEWQDLEIGAIIHFGPNSFMDKEWGDGTADPSVFNPAQFDPDQWMRAAKAAGVKYVIFVAKHHDGFCLWPSRETAYSVKSSPFRDGKADVVREVEQAARDNGLGFSVYLSPWDRHEPKYKDNKAYDNYYRRQLLELASHYGPLTEWWLDGAGSEGHVYDFDSYMRELRTYQQNTLVFADVGFLRYGDIRWVGNESGVASDENWNVVDSLGYLRYRPAEADTPLRKLHWFWHPNDEASVKSLPELLDIWHKTVGRGAQLVLGLAPDNRGLMPESDVQRLREFGAALRKIYSDNRMKQRIPAADKTALATDGNPDTFWAAPPDDRSAALDVRFNRPVTIDRAVTMEWLGEGQHVYSYMIEADQGGQMVPIVQGRTIGHKRVDLFAKITTNHVRLKILSAGGRIFLREFQLFDGSAVAAQ